MCREVLVIGGGVTGIQASLDLANSNSQVHLIEKKASIGGRMAQLDKTYPTMECSICILAPRMAACYSHQNIKVHTYSEVISVEGQAGNFKVKVLKRSRFVDEDICTGCGICTEKCPTRGISAEHDMGLGVRKAVYLPSMQNVPRIAVIDKEKCIKLLRDKCGVCAKKCPRDAIDYEMKDQVIELNVGAIIVATGFEPWDPTTAHEYGYGIYPNVYTSMEYERLLSASGPTGGHVQRRSDHTEPKSIAWIQCVGSRTTKHFAYCSSVCCMSATKEAMLVMDRYAASATIFYKDMRAYGKGFNEFVEKAANGHGVNYINSDAVIEEDPRTHNLIVVYDVAGKKMRKEFDMVVLSNALIPSRGAEKLAEILNVNVDEWKFFRSPDPTTNPVKTKVEGIFAAGYCTEPMDIPDSVAQGSAAAAQALVVLAKEG